MTKNKRIILIILAVLFGLVSFYYVMKWTTPKDCMVPLNRMSQPCIDFLYPR